MTFQKDSFSDDLEQIVSNTRSSLKLLEELQAIAPQLADDLAEMAARSRKFADDLEAITEREREREKNDDASAEN